MRIVSLLPSATEMLCAIGAADELVAVTHGCDFPASVAGLPRITSTSIPKDADSRTIDRMVRTLHAAGQPLYQLEHALLASLAPDLLITQGLCDVCAIPDAIAREAAGALPGGARVISLAPLSLSDVFANVLDLGDATGHAQGAGHLYGRMRSRVDAVSRRAAGAAIRPRVTLLEWIDPLYACGHWTPELVTLAGGEEGHGQPRGRSREIPWDQVLDWQPEVLILACCGLDIARAATELPLLTRKRGYDQLPAVRAGRVFVVDGSAYFSRSGPRLVESLELLGHLLHPELFPATDIPFLRVAAELASLTPIRS